MKRWPKADAVIMKSQVAVRDGLLSKTAFDVSYEYDLDGVKFLGDGIERFGFGWWNLHAPEVLVKTYPVGQRVEVLYDRHIPTIVYLERGPNIIVKLIAGIGCFCLFIALINFSIARARIRARRMVVRINAG